VNLRAQQTFHVATDHVGKLAKHVAHDVIHGNGRIHGKEAPRKAACLVPVALEKNCSVPVASEMDNGGQTILVREPESSRWIDIEGQHRPEYGLHDLRQFFCVYFDA